MLESIFSFLMTPLFAMIMNQSHRDGKIWSVVIVMALVILGFGVLLFILERRIKEMEEKLN